MTQPATKRLGKDQLGPHAFETRMPDRITRLLENDGRSNSKSDVMPKLAELLRQKHVQSAYLCHKHVVQVSRLAREGNGFCGYRNLQMLCLALGSAGLSEKFTTMPSITQLQHLIEDAWSAGYNANGLLQTGGIVGTRKHIGSPEVEALLHSLSIPCTSRAFHGKYAAEELLDFVSTFVSGSTRPEQTGQVHVSSCMPLFLQRPRHSMTVVGFAVRADGTRSLLVLDPGMPFGIGLHSKLSSAALRRMTAVIDLAIYCRSESRLSRYDAFEVIAIDLPGGSDSQ